MNKIYPIRKRSIAFGDATKYIHFLSQFVLHQKPTLFSVTQRKRIDTLDGPMYILHLVDDVANPEFEIIAEVILNGNFIYYWRNSYWTVAQAAQIESYQDGILVVPSAIAVLAKTEKKYRKAVTLVIYEIKAD